LIVNPMLNMKKGCICPQANHPDDHQVPH
jgi:hypothetical protein